MKRFTAIFVFFLLSIPSFAREARPRLNRVPASSLEVTSLPDARERALRLIATLHQREQRGPGAEAVIINRSARALVIPAAGNVPGQGGTHFRSDVTLANWNDRQQALGIIWLPNGGTGGMKFFTTRLEALSIVTIEDFVGEGLLEIQGLGAVVLFPVTDDGEEGDPNSAIDAYSRVWTPQPGATGTVSQPFAPVEPAYMTDEPEGIILGLRQDAQYRTNYGIVNISPVAVTFRLEILAEDGADPEPRTITVPSLGMIQTSIPSGDFGPLSIRLSVPNPPALEYTWIGFASSTDNITGDGWVSTVANPFNDEELDERDQ